MPTIFKVTFTRDWLAGSGKRAEPVTFSRDWLAGSGKRSAGPPLPLLAAATDLEAVNVMIEQYLAALESHFQGH